MHCGAGVDEAMYVCHGRSARCTGQICKGCVERQMYVLDAEREIVCDVCAAAALKGSTGVGVDDAGEPREADGRDGHGHGYGHGDEAGGSARDDVQCFCADAGDCLTVAAGVASATVLSCALRGDTSLTRPAACQRYVCARCYRDGRGSTVTLDIGDGGTQRRFACVNCYSALMERLGEPGGEVVACGCKCNCGRTGLTAAMKRCVLADHENEALGRAEACTGYMCASCFGDAEPGRGIDGTGSFLCAACGYAVGRAAVLAAAARV